MTGATTDFKKATASEGITTVLLESLKKNPLSLLHDKQNTGVK
jgi:hypothetical protein